MNAQVKQLLREVMAGLPMVIQHALKNPKTTGAGVAALATVPSLNGVAAKVSAIVMGVGLLLAKDGDQASTKPGPEVDAAVTKVEKMAPNTEPKP